MSQADSVPNDLPVPASEQEATPRRTLAQFLQSGSEGFTAGLTNRWTCAIMLAGLVAGFLLPVYGLGIPMCYMKATMGIPCPGCGLTRSVTAILHGQFHLGWQYNPFGFGFAVLFALLGPLFLLPLKMRDRLQAFLKPHDPKVFAFILIYGAFFVVFGITRVFLVEFKAPGFEWWTSADELPPVAALQTLHPAGNK